MEVTFNQNVFDVDGVQVVLHLPEGGDANDSCVIYEPGIGGDRVDHMRCGVVLSRVAQRMGLYCLRYDYRGTGITPGEFSEYSITNKMEVLEEIKHYLTQHYNIRYFYMVSFSEGAKIALWMCKNDIQTKAAVIWSPILTSEIVNYEEELTENHSLPRFVNHERYGIVLPVQGYYLGLRYFQDHKKYNFYFCLENSNIPIKIIFGEHDPFIDKMYFSTLKNPKINCWEIQNDGHLFNYDNMMEIIQKTVEYFNYLRKQGDNCE